MMQNMRQGIPRIFKQGTKHTHGVEEAILKNIEACQELTEMTRTSLGPNGMHKMVINHIEKLFVTSDAATIINESEIVHPAAKMIVLAAQMQEQEVGDGSNFVVVLAGELLSKASQLLEMGLHPSDILAGYNLAAKHALTIIDELEVAKIEEKQIWDKEKLTMGIKTAIASKQYGYEKLLASIVAEACLIVMPTNVHNFVVENVRIAKVLGGNLNDSKVIAGMVIGHDTLGTVKKVENARIAVFQCSIDAATTETKGTVLIHNADELMNYNESEEKHIQAVIKSFSDAGVNVLVTGEGVGEMAKHFINKYNIMVLKIQSKHELRRLCKAVGAESQTKLGPVAAQDLGFCKRVYVTEIGNSNVTVFAQDSKDRTAIATVLLRSSTLEILNDVERAVDDGINSVRQLCRDGRLLAGAGACDIELSRKLAAFAETRSGLEQYACKSFADALQVVPRTLAENAGQTAIDAISALLAAHEKGDVKAGIDIETGDVKDMTEQGVYDLYTLKKKGLELATNAVITILRVDQIIWAKPAGGPKMPKGQGHWDDD